jgi:lysophospholipase L1-like esterase
VLLPVGRLLATLAGAAVIATGVACARDAGAKLPDDRSAALRYVALGDSTVEGIGATAPALTYVSRLHARLRQIYPSAAVTNLGVGGAVSADVATRQLPRAVELGPDLVTLSVGPNDVTRGVPLERYEENMKTIFETLRRETGAVIVVTLLPDLAVTPRFRGSPHRETVGAQAVAFNEALARQAKAHRAVIVDLHEASRVEVPRRPELVGRDGYHPSDAGYARWAELMWEAIAPLTAGR